MPHCLWIWDMTTLELSNVLIHYNPIKSVAWAPKSQHLAFCTGTSQIFLWSREGASVCTIPIEAKDFGVQKVEWNPNGRSLIVVDKARLTIACPQPEFFGSSLSKEMPSKSEEHGISRDPHDLNELHVGENIENNENNEDNENNEGN